MKVNAGKLNGELKAAGIPIDGCNSNGAIWFRVEATATHRALAQDLLAQHDSSPTVEQRFRALREHARMRLEWLQLKAILQRTMPDTDPKVVELQRLADAEDIQIMAEIERQKMEAKP